VDPERARRTRPDTIFRAYLALARQAAAEKPDLIVLPETAMSCFINDEFVEAPAADLEEIWQRRFPYRSRAFVESYQRFSRMVRDEFQELSTQSGVPIILGSGSLEWRPKGIPPRVEAFNSAFLLRPGEARPVARYDKMHLVLFGEYVPFRTSYRPLYEWLNSKTPWGRAGIEYSLMPGSEYTVFEFQAASQQQRRYRAAVPICYEEVMPYIARRFTRGNGESPDQKNIDMLLTISNDGWFLHSAELEQHLATGVFRAVENRIAVARSVNTGASAQIHPNGKIHDYVVLSEEKSALLDPVVAALGRLAALVDELAAQVQADEVYRTTFDELRRVFLEDLHPAVLAVGPEFTYIDERLGPSLYELTAKQPQFRREAVQEFREHLEEELDMIARWRDKPWTAPGYIIADMKCDDRVAIYTRWGDWFAQGMVALFAVMLLDWLLRRAFRRRAQETKDAGPAVGSAER
jgi:apolipoprotein N-acyltransferase